MKYTKIIETILLTTLRHFHAIGYPGSPFA
jgi:hypothetical protein